MPETNLASPPGGSAEQTLEQVIADHPGLATPDKQGGKLNDYHPVALPDDPTAQEWLEQYSPSGQPAPQTAQQQPDTTRPEPPASSQPERGGLIFGKYKTQEEAERGYWETVKRQQAVERENTALKAVNLHLEQVFAPMRQVREEPPKQPQFTPVQFQGDQPVVSTDSFVTVAEERARAAAREEVRNALEPLQKLNSAQARMTAEFPDFSQRQTEFAQWLAANPTYQERVVTDPESGLELAYLRYERETGNQRQAASAQATQQAQGRIENARSAASASTSSTGTSVRRTTELDNRAARLTELYRYANETGDWGPYRKARLEEALGDNFLNTLNQSNWGR